MRGAFTAPLFKEEIAWRIKQNEENGLKKSLSW